MNIMGIGPRIAIVGGLALCDCLTSGILWFKQLVYHFFVYLARLIGFVLNAVG